MTILAMHESSMSWSQREVMESPLLYTMSHLFEVRGSILEGSYPAGSWYLYSYNEETGDGTLLDVLIK